MYEKNNFSKRLLWVRNKLELECNKIARIVPMPVGTLFLLETQGRTGFYEQVQRLASIYNDFWQIQYNSDFPKLNGVEVKEITFLFLCFGRDENREKLESLKKQLEKKYQRELKSLMGKKWK